MKPMSTTTAARRARATKSAKTPARSKTVKMHTRAKLVATATGAYRPSPLLLGARAAETAALKTLAARVRKLEARIEDLEDLAALNEAIARSNGKARPWSEVEGEILAKDGN
jgi:hypothetical protein